jgi:putative phosphoribosyl transferase
LELAKREFAATPVVLALPRGGVPVGFEIAEQLHAPLDIFVVRKLGIPDDEELAMGAIASGGVRVLNERLVEHLRIPDDVIEEVTAREQVELARRERVYRGERPMIMVISRPAILVDDGLATGATVRAAIAGLRQREPASVTVALPVGPREACDELRGEADEVICLVNPQPFSSVGLWYDDFAQISDEQVRDLLEKSRHAR